MSVIQLKLPPDLEQFAVAQAKSEGHVNLDAYLLDVLRKLRDAKSKFELEAKLLIGVEQLERGEGRSMSVQDWTELRGNYRQRHGISDDT